MYRIGIIGPKTCYKTREVKDLIYKIKQTYGNTATIVSGGNETGIERDAKKFALQFELPYQEFNPSFTGHNLYSAMEEGYYTKGYHSSHFIHRYSEMLKRIDRLVIGYEAGENFKLYASVQKLAEKMKIKTVLL